jgi:hypothetical protein
VEEQLNFECSEEPAAVVKTEPLHTPEFSFSSSSQISMASSIAYLNPEATTFDFYLSEAFLSPRKFFAYVLPYAEKFPQLEKELTAACQLKPRARPRQLRVGAALAVCDHDTYYRAELLDKKGDDEFEVFLLDTGETKLVPLAAVKALPSEFLETPRCVLECRLAGITHKPEHEDEIREFITTSVDDTQSTLGALVVSLTNGVAEIEVLFQGQGASPGESLTLSSFLIDLGWAQEKAEPAGRRSGSDGFRAEGRLFSKPSQKLRFCPRYERNGYCAYGDNCQFLHKLPKPGKK